MSEIYTGVQFKTIFRTREIPHNPEVQRLKEWCRHFADLGLAPKRDNAYAGNLSIRAKPGLIITAAGANLGNLAADDLVQVIDADREHRSIYVHGMKEPSSESFLHHAIYASRAQVNAVFHGHDELVLRYWQDLHLPITVKEQPYGTLALVDEVLQVLGKHSYIVIRNHGFIAIGKDLDQAGEQALEKHRLAQQYTDSTVG